MKKAVMTAIALALMSGVAVAQTEQAPDSSDLSTKAAKDAPATDQDGMTANPTAQPETGGLPDKAMKDAPGTEGGMTDDPTAEPDTDALSDKAKEGTE